MVQVVEDYRDFEPPTDVRGHIEMLLSRLRPSQVQGLASVVLTNRAALSHDGRRHKTRARGKKVPLAESLGSYQQAWKGQPPGIRVLVDNALGDIPRWALRLPVVPTVCLAMVLYHEVGHHIHATSQPEPRERRRRGSVEQAADPKACLPALLVPRIAARRGDLPATLD